MSTLTPSRIVVIGGSAGSIEILHQIARELPPDFPAAVFVVQHLSPDYPSTLAHLLSRKGGLPVSFVRNQERIVPSKIYLAPPDHHLVVSEGCVKLSRGPRENRARPAIDVLFRSAALAYGNAVIAVLLSGLLDDGVQGLQVVSSLGGTVIVLKPSEASFPQLPENAIKFDHPNYVLRQDEIVQTLRQLIAEGLPRPAGESSQDFTPSENTHGYVCPDCGGPLFAEGTNLHHFRCLVGHAYSLDALLAAENDTLETALWAAVRSLEENAEIKRRAASAIERVGSNPSAQRLREAAQTQADQAKYLRERIIETVQRS
jgi:two-component system chemotaxis response regulator CheB